MSNINDIWKKLEKTIRDSVKGAVSDSVALLYKEIVDRTPVDTGGAHRGWEINYGSGFRKAKASFSGSQQSIVDKNTYKLGNTITIRNELPYMQRLEFGWSKQAPMGMIRVSALKFKQFLATATKKNKI